MGIRVRQEKTDALAAIDLHAEEVGIYEFLLECPGSDLTEISASTDLSLAHAQQWIRHLEEKGLISRSLHQNARYRAIPPDLCFGALVARRQSELQEVLALAEELGKKEPVKLDAERNELTVELITGREALIRTIEQIHHSAKHEILELDRPPYLTTYHQHNTMRDPVIRRQVSFRTIIDTRGLEAPGRAQHIRDSIAAGEVTRVFHGVPIKAAIVDRHLALVPLHLKSASESGLLLRQSLLLDLLCAHFEMLWDQATPFEVDSYLGEAAISSSTNELVALLANGLKDKAIAQRLRLSDRTLGRHVADLQKQLNARTRFQAGWRAALRSVGTLSKPNQRHAEDSRDGRESEE